MARPELLTPLDLLADEINDLHRQVEVSMRTTLQAALRCGAKLVEAKSLVRHGEWAAWRDEHFAGSRSSAELYMRLYRRRDAIPDGVGIREADRATRRNGAGMQRRLKPVTEIQNDVIDAATVLADVFSLPVEDAYSRAVACDALASALARAAAGFRRHAASEVIA